MAFEYEQLHCFYAAYTVICKIRGRMLPGRLHDEIRALQGFTSSAAGPVVAQYCKYQVGCLGHVVEQWRKDKSL